MLNENELIMHESAGVCRLKGKEKPDRHHGYYYVLSPFMTVPPRCMCRWIPTASICARS